MVKIIVLLVFIFLGCATTAQVRLGNNVINLNNASLLKLESSTKRVLLPRMALTKTETFAPLQALVIGMTVYNTTTTENVTLECTQTIKLNG